MLTINDFACMQRILGKKAGENTRKLAYQEPPAQSPIECPECASQRVWKDGVRQTKHGDVQRYLCRCCGLRFSKPEQKRIVKFKVEKNIVFQSAEKLNSRSDFTQISVGHSDFAVKKALNDPSFSTREDVGSDVDSCESTTGKDINAFSLTVANAKVCDHRQSRSKKLGQSGSPTKTDCGGHKAI
jgi:transposase-like protein